MNNQTDVSIKFKNYVEGEKKLEKYAQMLAQIKSLTQGIDTTNLKSIDNNANAIAKDVNKIAKNTSRAFNYTAVREFTRAIGRLTTAYGKAVGKSTEYLENINLYQVAFDGNTKSADRFINTMSEMYGLDESWLTRTVGIFKQLANAMGVSAETGERLSTLLTQMSLDIASLYNVDMERASSVLQSAMAGQTKPIRGLTGGDITQATLQTTLDNLGIQRSIAELSFAEKRLIIIVSLTQQLNESIGDMGRTIESPANQIRVMNSQWDRMTRAVGNALLPTIASILPYVNAILMVITEILNAVATFFGYSEGDYDYFAGVADSVLEMEERLEGANQSAQKLKQGLRGFDKLNVITTPTSASAGGGTGGSNIDPDIMNAFNSAYDDYLAKLEKTEMRATKIRDAIMEWLGFVKVINPLTGEISWQYKGLEETIKSLWSSFKKLPTTAKLFVALLGGMAISKVITSITTLVKLLGSTGLGKAVLALLSPFKSLTGYFKTYYSMTKSVNGAITGGLSSWHKHLTKVDSLKVAVVGLVAGYTMYDSALKKVNDTQKMSIGSFLQMTTGIATMTASLSQAISKFTGWGSLTSTLVGGLAVAVVTIGKSVVDGLAMQERAYNSTINAHLKYKESLESANESALASANVGLAQIDRVQELTSELENLIGSNGKVQESDETRVRFILNEMNKAFGTEYELIDGIITQNGKQYKSYGEVTKSIEKMIEAKKTEILLSAYEEDYTNALKTRKEIMDKIEQKQRTIEGLQERYNQSLKTGRDEYGITTKELERSIKRNEEAIENLQGTYDEAEQKILDYEDLMEASLSGNAEDLEKAMENYGVVTENTLSETADVIKDHMNETHQSYVDAWGDLAKTSEETFLKEFKKLPKDVQEKVVNEMHKKGRKISEELQKGIEEVNPEINIKLDGSDLKKKALKMLDSMSTTWKAVGFDISGITQAKENIRAWKFAQGGLPPVGQLFVANEQGAEFVGHLGGQTFVANQNQMMELLDRKLGQAQGTGQKVFNFYLDEGHKIATYTLDQLEEMAISNGKPIKIGG